MHFRSLIHSWRWTVPLLAITPLVACGGDDTNAVQNPDSGTDSAMPGRDAGVDATPPVDGLVPVDAPADHFVAPVDAQPDVGTPAEAGEDAGVDAEPVDAGMDVVVPPVDAGIDSGTVACTTTAAGPLRGSALALTPDNKRLIAVNRDVGSVTVASVDYSSGAPVMTLVAELAVGGEPSQVAVDACGKRAFVVLRKDQKVVAIENLDATPTIGANVAVGSEPAALALTPNGTALYVSNWVDGTITVIDPIAMVQTTTIDLNGPLVATGALGASAVARPALAHPRGIAITNNGDSSDTDEIVYVTEWYAARTAPETAAGADTTHEGLVYEIKVISNGVATIPLPPVASTGFTDVKGNATGCFPNQVASVSINAGFAYVTSTCASPAGPLGVFQKNSCLTTANCVPSVTNPNPTCVAGACTGTCVVDTDCSSAAPAGTCNVTNGTCAPETATVKTTTHPAVSIINLGNGTATTQVLDALSVASTPASTRMALLPTDIAFFNGFGYVTAEGADAVFRLVLNNSTGAIASIGSAVNQFINLRATPGDSLIRLPMGIATSSQTTGAFAFVENEGSRDITALDLGQQAIAGTSPSIFQASALPTAGTPAASELAGKRFFNTGLGRWSLSGAAWGSCGACHIDGLSDNITWYFNRGPRQSVSLDGTFNKNDPTDQRILNWTGIFDEVADFEANVRGVSGGVGAIVSTSAAACTVATQATDCPHSLVCNPATLTCNIANGDRIGVNGETPPQTGLQGSSTDAADPAGASAHPHSVLANWKDIQNYIATIRSPRAPTTLDATDVLAGAALFSQPSQGNCIGCHSGGKWTISKTFYTPGDLPNAATADMAATSLSTISWNTPANLNGFPAPLFPATTAAGSQFMRQGAAPALEQLQCILRPVGTIALVGGVVTGVSDPSVGVLELRQDMVTGGQGAGAGGTIGIGFNPPSLLGLQVGAPYFHAGNARTLEEAFSDTLFKAHFQSAVAQVFDPSNGTQLKQLVAFLLSIDGSTTPVNVPAASNAGGDFCHYP